MTLTSAPMHLQPKPRKLQVYNGISKPPSVQFYKLTVEACMHRKFVKHVTSQRPQQFELDAHSRTPRRQEQLGVTGMPTKQHDTAYALGWLQP